MEGIFLIDLFVVFQLLKYKVGGLINTDYGDFLVQADDQPAIHNLIYQYVNQPGTEKGYLV